MKKVEPESPELQPADVEEQELVRVVPIRTETTLTRFPFHRIAKRGNVKIKQTKKDARGKVDSLWEVRNPPGPLAYKLDTLVINRRFDELRPGIPTLIKLGSLGEICREMGINPSGKNTNSIKEALRENAFAGITCKIAFTGKGGKSRTFEFNTTRYTVIFTGEALPNGKKADAVYIELHPRYHEMLNHSKTRPLDYEYLKVLPPAAQRLYELLSFSIFASLTYSLPYAQMLYSDFCQCAPLTRYQESRKMRSQMWKIHQPHIEAGYIKSVEFEETRDAQGAIDWVMKYAPGKKARRDHRLFNTKEGKRELDQQQSVLRLVRAERQEEQKPIKQVSKLSSKQESLLTGLIAFKVAEGKARELVEKLPEQVERELESFPHRDRTRMKDPAAWLIRAIESGDYTQPPKVEKKRAEKKAQAEQKRREELRERFQREYTAYLRAELDALKNRDKKTHQAFSQEFAKYWEYGCGDLSEDKRPMMELYYFENFVKERQFLGVLSFEDWAKREQTGSLAG